jgi:hypothetical protein
VVCLCCTAFGRNQAAAQNTQSVIDCMAIYSPSATSGAGGEQTVRAMIEQAYSEVNRAFAASDAEVRLNLVHVAQSADDEFGNTQADLNAIRDVGDGLFDDIPELKERFGADLVTFVTEANSGSGIGRATQLTQLLPAFADRAFNVVLRSALVGEFTLAHEIGHNLGCHHVRGDTGSGRGLLDCSFGYRFVAGQDSYRTVMARSFGEKIGYFSNPDVLFLGEPAGIRGDESNCANNVETLNTSAPFVAAFQSHKISNDNFVDAIELRGVNIVASGVNHDASVEIGEPSNGVGGTGATLWWHWQAPTSDSFTVQVGESSMPCLINVYQGNNLDELQRVSESSDSHDLSVSSVLFGAARGEEYWIAVDTLSGQTGFVEFQLGKDNDDFLSRLRLVGDTHTATGISLNATLEPREPFHGQSRGFFSGGSNSLWWEWIPDLSGVATLATQGSSVSTRTGVYRGTELSSLDVVAEQVEDRERKFNSLEFDVVGGEAYQIAVIGVGGLSNPGGFLSIRLDVAPKAELRLGAVSRNLEGHVELSVEGFSPAPFAFEFSDDLSTWHLIKDDITISPSLQLLDPDAGNNPIRFYRLRITL